MDTWITHFWSRLRTGFWFVPGSCVIVFSIMAWGLIEIDRGNNFDGDGNWQPLQHASPDGVMTLLSTTATAVLTLSGLTFSATIVALTLATNQFGSRILRNFIRALPNQFALGILLGTFVFCLIVLRSVRSPEDGQFIPHLTVSVAFISTLASLAAFIYFVHHISVSLQADRVVSAIHSELNETIERFFPDCRPEDPDESSAREEKTNWEDLESEVPLHAPESGYVQAVNMEGLVAKCSRFDLECRVLHRPGQFVHEGDALLAVSGHDPRREQALDELRSEILIGRIRTAEQDFEFCLRQLVEIALRALSTGINDPFTAMNCIDYLGDALAKVSTRKLPKRRFTDGNGKTRVRIRPTRFADLLGSGFHQIRQAAVDRPDVAIRLLTALTAIAARAQLGAHREAIQAQAHAISTGVKTESECDLEAVNRAHAKLQQALQAD